MKYLVLITALILASIAGYFSIFGLQKLFVGAGLSIIILGTVLEVSKLVTVSFLHQKWKEINYILKVYLLLAVTVLMLITSLGIYGYLANGYNATAISVSNYENQISENNKKIFEIQEQINNIQEFDYERYNNLILQEQEQINNYNKRLDELDQILEQIKQSQRGLFKKKDDSYDIEVQKQKIERDNIKNLIQISFNKIEDYKKEISFSKNKSDKQTLLAQISEIRNNNKELQIKINKTDIGTFRFISKSLKLETDLTVNLFIVLIMFTFDPLAVSLVVCFNTYNINNKMKKEELTKLSKDELLQIANQKNLTLKKRFFKKNMVKELHSQLKTNIENKNFRTKPTNNNS